MLLVEKRARIEKTGKWTQEEEAYASKLIHDFEAGMLTDCEEGATLRSYLSRMLKCSPMRISKKFAGRNIGRVSILFKSLLCLKSSLTI